MKRIDVAVLSVAPVGYKQTKSTELAREYNKSRSSWAKSKESPEKKDSSETTQSENGLDEFGLPILTGK